MYARYSEPAEADYRLIALSFLQDYSLNSETMLGTENEWLINIGAMLRQLSFCYRVFKKMFS